MNLTPKPLAAGMLAAVLLGASACRRSEVPPLLTTAESSNYTKTSSYEDVVAFLDTLRARHAPLTFGTIGKTTEGRDIPYVIASRPLVSTPDEARKLGRPIVYVNANIHAGEVEGKEALLALLRDLTAEQHPNVLDSIVLIAVPIYNADGNEAFRPQAVNRSEQNGPELVGQRPNAQGFDLNRDYMKAEAPETRGALAMFNKWDPDVYVDLHTTDGSYHGYALTYSPSLNPAAYGPGTAGVLTRDTILPELRARMHERGFEIFDYGNFSVDERDDLADTVKKGWYSYDHRPRFGTNYYGIRDRVSILSEAFSHDPFKRRVESTYAFTREILSSAARHSASLLQIRAAADSGRSADVPIRAQLTTHPFDAPVPFEVLRRTGDSTVTQPGVPAGFLRTGRFITQVMPIYDRFEPTLTVTMPSAYFVPAEFTDVIALLRTHGLAVDSISPTDTYRKAAAFVLDSVSTAPHPFQKHRETRVVGRWRDRPVGSLVGGVIVPATGRLGALAAYLLEPESDDGLLDWNFFDAALAPGMPYPVLRLYK